MVMFDCENHGSGVAAIACAAAQCAVQRQERMPVRVVVDGWGEPILLCEVCAGQVLSGPLPWTEFERPLGLRESLGALCPACVEEWLGATGSPNFAALAAGAARAVFEESPSSTKHAHDR